jgi:hypothetical protein
MSITITGRMVRRTLLVLVVLAVVITIVWALRSAAHAEVPSGLSHDRYQAITLDSGEIYFGRLQPLEDGFYELRDAHFARQQASSTAKDAETELVPVTEQPHHPRGVLFVAARHLVLAQPLDPDSSMARQLDED